MYLLCWDKPVNNSLSPIRYWGSKKDTLPVHSLEKSLSSWGWIAHYKVWSYQPPLDFSCSVKNKWPKNHLYSQDDLHGRKQNFSPYPPGTIPWWGRTCKNMLRTGWVLHNLTHFTVDGEGQWGIPHLTLTTPVLDFFYNDTTSSWHGMTKLRSKIFRHVQLCSSVHVY